MKLSINLSFKYFDDLDIYIIPPYWLVSIGVFLAGIIIMIDKSGSTN